MRDKLTIYLVFVLCAAFSLAARTGRYEKHKLYKVKPVTSAQLQTLLKLSTAADNKYDFLTLSRQVAQTANVLVSPQHEKSFRELLEDQQITSKLLDSNFGHTLEQSVFENRLLRQLKPYTGTGRLSTTRYYSHSEINAYLDDLAQRYPSRAFVRVYGKSFEGRLLKTISITNGDGRAGKNVIFIDGGFHAREWISPATAIYTIGELVENYAAHGELLKDYDFIILPVVNADGYEYTQLSADTRKWRKTRQPFVVNATVCVGADPNRNFDFHWMGKGTSSDPCTNTYAGPRPFSEPETMVVRDIMHSLRGRGVMYLTLHSYGSALYYPWGWGPELPDTWEDLHEVGLVGADAIRAYSGAEYVVGSWAALYGENAGTSLDYAFNEGFAISYTMELPKRGSTGFDPPASEIDHLVKESFAGIRAMAKRVTEKYPIKYNV